MKIVGYITSDPMYLGFVSHQHQNQIIKNFVEEREHQFLLSWTEYKGASPFVFRSLLKESFFEGICFYSIEQLESTRESMNWIQRLSETGLWIGFAREGVFFQGALGLDEVKRLAWLKRTLDQKRPELEAIWEN